MFLVPVFFFLLALLQCNVECQDFLNTPPRVEIRPVLLDSFIPAGMQLIAHATELMKFESSGAATPPPVAVTTPPSFVNPTRPHKPGVYQPEFPPGPDVYFAKGLTYEEYVERLKYPSGHNYFDHLYNSNHHGRSLDGDEDDSMYYSNVYGEIPRDLDRFFSKESVDLMKLVNKIDDDDDLTDQEGKVDRFVKIFDESPFRSAQVRKQIKEVKAYVSLLSLYEDLNKESKVLKLNKYSGYSDNVLKVLVETSSGTSAVQLHSVLTQIVDRMDTKNPKVVKRILKLITDLETANSSVNNALRLIPPLKFVP